MLHGSGVAMITVARAKHKNASSFHSTHLLTTIQNERKPSITLIITTRNNKISWASQYSQSEKGHVFTSWLWVLLSMLVRHPSHHYFTYFFCLLYVAYACMYGYNNSIGGTCEAIVQRESFIFCHYLWNSWDRGLDVFYVATTMCTGLTKPCSNFGLLFCLTFQFFTTAADLL